MKTWKFVKLKDLENVKVILGQSPSSKSYNDNGDGLPFLQGKAEFGMLYPSPKKYTSSPIKIAEKNDILISVRAPVGDVNLAPYKLCIGRGLAALKIMKDDPMFYFYWFQLNHKLIENMGTGSTFKAITGEQIKKIELPVVNLPEQKAIAEILSTVDEAIQKADEAIKKTERIKQGIMHKLLTEGIGHKEFKQTKIGKIPKEWEVKKIGDLGQVVTGKTPSTLNKNYWNGNIPFITPGDISAAKFTYTTERYITEEAAKKSSPILPKNSLMVVCIGSTIGKVGLSYSDCITNQQINSIIINNDVYNSHYLYYAFLRLSKKFKAYSGTAAVPIIKKSLFEKYQLPIPTFKEQQKISKILSEFDSKIELSQKRKQKLEKIKLGLMNDLLTGKKRVRLN